MTLIVQKYGGTSVGSVERIEAVANRVAKHHNAGEQLVVVVSAMSGETNRLLGLAKSILDDPTPRELDIMMSTGEQVSMALLTMALHKRGIGAVSLNGSQVRILTDDSHTKRGLKILIAGVSRVNWRAATWWWSPVFRALMKPAMSRP